MDLSSVVLPTLRDLATAWSSIPSKWALIGHCLYCASTAQDLRAYFIVHFWITFLTGFGGGTVTAYLTMRPDKAAVGLLSNNFLAVTWVVCWWIMNYFPYRIPAKIHSFWPIKMVTKACVALCKTKLIISRVDLAHELYPDNMLAAAILGSLSGSGGKMLSDTIRVAQGLQTSPHEANVPTYSWRCAFLATAIYYFAAKCPLTLLMSSEEAFGLLATLLVSHTILSDVTGLALDWTQPIVSTMLTLANIPVPGTAQAPAPLATKKATAAAGSKQQQAANPKGVEQQEQQQGQETQAEKMGSRPAAGQQAADQAWEQQAQAQGEGDSTSGSSFQAIDSTTGSKGTSASARRKAAKKGDVPSGWTEVVYKKKEEGKKAK